jgi:hypothetical protein
VDEEAKRAGQSLANWRLIIYGALVVIVGPLAGVVIWWLRVKVNGNRRKRPLLASISTFLVAVLWPLREYVPPVLQLWAAGFFLCGWGPWAVDAIEWMIDHMRYKTTQERQAEWQAEVTRYHHRAAQGFQEQEAPPLAPGYLQLGYLAPDAGVVPEGLGFTIVNHCLAMKLEKLFEHLSIFGTTGAGKNWLMYWMIYQLAHMTDWNLFVVECKGSEWFASQAHNLLVATRGIPQQKPIFQCQLEMDIDDN